MSPLSPTIYYFFIAGEWLEAKSTFHKGISFMWKTNSLIQGLNAIQRVHSARRYNP